MKQRIIFIVGPTAIGKSEIAFLVAKKMKAEIISCDSMQVYKYMDIITSKPKKLFQREVVHHMIDIVLPHKSYNVSRYRRDATLKVKEILKNGRVPIFAGGTGLYVSILLRGIFETKAQNKNIRRKLYKEAAEFTSSYLHDRLRNVDPRAASKIHPNDTKRIIRALEVYQTTGQAISKLQQERKGLVDQYEVMVFGLNMPRDKLYQRIDRRVDKMFACGLVEEVKKLLRLKLSQTAACAIGIKELKSYFEGKCDVEEAKRLIKKNTRAYAKRQLTWFKKDKRIQWIEIGDKEKPQAIAKKIWKELF